MLYDLGSWRVTGRTGRQELPRGRRFSHTNTAHVIDNFARVRYATCLSALPQRIVFEIRGEPKGDRIHLRYDEQLAPWYLAVLVAVAAIMTPYWLGFIAMLFHFSSATTQLQEFHAVQIWASGAAGVVFVWQMLASGVGITSALLEEIRARLRRLGASVDQQQTGTITTKLLISLLFMFHLVAVLLLGLFSVRSPVFPLFPGKPTDSLVIAGAIALLLVIGFAIVKGTLRTDVTPKKESRPSC